MSDLTNNHRNWYPHPADASPSAHDLGIKGNSVKHGSLPPVLSRHCHSNASQPLFFSLPRISEMNPGTFVYFSTSSGVGERTRLFFGLLKPLPPFFSSSDEKKL